MGLDVHVGSLTRYYTEGPADVVERIARHQEMAVADGQEAEEVIRAAVLRWRENLGRWLGDRPARPLDWDESSPAPCVTDKPGWDGYGGAPARAAGAAGGPLPPGGRPAGGGPRRPLPVGGGRQRPGRTPPPGRPLGPQPGADEARLLSEAGDPDVVARRGTRPFWWAPCACLAR
jgi:hypothetical protein